MDSKRKHKHKHCTHVVLAGGDGRAEAEVLLLAGVVGQEQREGDGRAGLLDEAKQGLQREAQDRPQRVLDAHGREGDEGVPVLDGHVDKAQAVPPQQFVPGRPGGLERLGDAPREEDQGLPLLCFSFGLVCFVRSGSRALH